VAVFLQKGCSSVSNEIRELESRLEAMYNNNIEAEAVEAAEEKLGQLYNKDQDEEHEIDEEEDERQGVSQLKTIGKQLLDKAKKALSRANLKSVQALVARARKAIKAQIAKVGEKGKSKDKRKGKRKGKGKGKRKGKSKGKRKGKGKGRKKSS
jgi:hypothetical protein